jgi:mono/diheme cytochrome c family protein
MIRPVLLAGLLLVLAACSEGPASSTTASTPDRAATRSDVSRAYLQYCGGCHGAPRPGSHVAREWPSIVARMQQRRISARLGPIPPEQLRDIIDYLQANAAGGPPQ